MTFFQNRTKGICIHIKIKVPLEQNDSYVDKYMSYSINLMAISNANKLFTYVFIGYPGSAHDAMELNNILKSLVIQYLYFQVFSNSLFVRDIEENGKQKYFPLQEYHIIGDSG